MSKRVDDWDAFSRRVRTHLDTYTVPQYGDKGDDAITDYSINDCLTASEKYIKRYGKNSREGQQELDFLKMAHYVQCAYEKYMSVDVGGSTGFTIELEDTRCILPEEGVEYVGSIECKDGVLRYAYRRDI